MEGDVKNSPAYFNATSVFERLQMLEERVAKAEFKATGLDAHFSAAMSLFEQRLSVFQQRVEHLERKWRELDTQLNTLEDHVNGD